MKRIFILTLLLISILNITAQEARLMRFPAIHGDQVVFSYAGDLFTVNSDGGTARKLTNDVGYEMFPRFSPDGQTIAFTAQYDGNTELYSMPADGGIPIRLTTTATLGRDDISDRMGPNNICMTWSRDGEHIVYRSRKQSFNSFVGQLFQVSKDGGMSEQLPLPTGGFCSYSPDGSKLAFNRVFREFRTWKYYKGGMADDVWIYDFNTKETINITNNDAQDVFPMWFGEEVYFLSDRDRTMNLFVYNTTSKEIKKLTDFTEYDIKFPSAGQEKIVFENGGYIYSFDTKTKESKKLSIYIKDDMNHARNEIKDVSKSIKSFDLAPDAKRIVFGARGDIYSVPVKEGITMNYTKSSGVHERNAEWSPDGKWIAYISDKSDEFEIYIQDQEGKEEAIQLTKNADTYKFHLLWSPDSKKIIWSDKKLRLRYIDIETKKITEVAQSTVWEFNSFNWSPDSKWVTYSTNERGIMSRVMLFNSVNKETYAVTDGWYSSRSPEFSEDGKYLLFVSDRDFNPIYSQTEWNVAYRDMSKIYMVMLSKNTPNPFAASNDMVNEEEEEKEDFVFSIDTDGINDRIISLPVEASNYWSITMFDNSIYYCRRSAHDSKTEMLLYDIVEKEETSLGNYGSYEISNDHKKMLVANHGKYYVVNLPKSSIKLSTSVDLSEMKNFVNYAEEWEQIYDEAWRQMRDFFYVENMHGLDWDEMHDKYAVLLPYVKHRNDLNYIIGELIGELSVGHAYISGGDRPTVNKIKTGLLGAQMHKDKSGYFVLDMILDGANWSNKLRSPLTEIGVDLKEGDFILAVNGVDLKEVNDIYTLLIDKANSIVELTVNSSASYNGSRNVLVKPIADESELYYYAWVQENIRKVNEATNGEVGYIHVPDMGVAGLNEFMKHFYPQLSKKALIIDDRGNGGGNVSPMLIERLRRQVTRANMARNVSEPSQTPRQMMLGPVVLLMNNYSASDGDLFPYSFKKHNLGTVIGVRSWGGVVGIRGSLPFIDGADMRKPEFASYSSEGDGWIIEGYGVDPDIVIDNDPAKEYAGEDQQLNKAIEVILEDLKEYKGLPAVPEDPDKSK
jgi:tricorn protease